MEKSKLQISDGNGESHKWEVIYRISMGIAKGLDYLHTGLQKPIIHGNIKSKNVILGIKQHSFISDFGLHLLLNPAAAQEMHKFAVVEGYTTPELSEIKDNPLEIYVDTSEARVKPMQYVLEAFLTRMEKDIDKHSLTR
ncbi:Protein kinase, catalytic domain-containing protein [Cynara cardunculus var. scolymus]|uniref:Protein kinase, catalytic domain-containing protein n=1 Tax=Cynara cardunculus var. scolymus TaxID=59895 RepID=A0A103XEV5_CYNCS|nr:Protein kinase, catalytic domain-containing protein [Cynara cardunculus var. scolymus]